MKKLAMIISIAALIVGVCFTTQSYANSFYASTDVTGYTGTLTKYGSLSDAQNHNNPLGGPYTIPDRVTASPYNTAYRDLGLYLVNNVPSYVGRPIEPAGNNNQINTAWWYTTGSGNPNNINPGFMQIYDVGNITVTSMNGNFGTFDGTYYTTFRAQVSGQNADYANSYARLWEAPGAAGAGEKFISYDLDVTFGGLQGTAQNGMITSTGHPTLAVGTFQAIFQYTSTEFYDVNFTLGMDNWAVGQGASIIGGLSPSEFGAPIPLPSTALLLGSGLAGLAFWRKRRAIFKG